MYNIYLSIYFVNILRYGFIMYVYMYVYVYFKRILYLICLISLFRYSIANISLYETNLKFNNYCSAFISRIQNKNNN